MKIGEVTFSFGSNVLDSNYVVDRIMISTGVMKLPEITFSGTLRSKSGSLIFEAEYQYSLTYKSKTWAGYLTLVGASTPTKGGSISLKGYLLPRELALGKASRYYSSISDGITALCNGLKLPENLSTNPCYYNQVGKSNGLYSLELAVRNSGYMIPGYDLEGLVLIDYLEGGAKTYDLNSLGKLSEDTGTQLSKSKKSISEDIDLFDVTSRSGQFYGMVGIQSTREIVSADYLPSYEAYATNMQLLDDSTRSVEILIGDLCIGNLGDNVSYGTPSTTYVIIESVITIVAGATETKYKLRRL